MSPSNARRQEATWDNVGAAAGLENSKTATPFQVGGLLKNPRSDASPRALAGESKFSGA